MRKPTTPGGRVYRRGGTWWIDVRVQGRRIRRSAGATHAEAAAELRAIQRGKGLRWEDLERLIVEDHELRNTASSIRILRGKLTNLSRTFSGRSLATITWETVRDFASKMQGAGKAPATIRAHLAVISRMYTLAQARGLAVSRPFIPRVRPSAPRSRFLDPPEVARLIAGFPPGPALAAVEFAWLTGWRLASEVLTRRWVHIDSDAVRLDPDESKTRAARTFPRTVALQRILSDRRRAVSEIEGRLGEPVEWVFCNAGGGPLPNIYREWKAAVQATGIVCRPHDLRRSAARHLLRQLKDASAVMQLCGWRSPTMLLRYAMWDRSRALEVGLELDAAAGE